MTQMKPPPGNPGRFSLRSTVARVREREIAAAATSETLHELARQGVSGREWLDTAKSEGHNPLLFLPVCDVNAREQTL